MSWLKLMLVVSLMSAQALAAPAKSPQSQTAVDVAMFINQVAELDKARANSDTNPEDLDKAIKALNARYLELRSVLRQRTPGIGPRALKAMERARKRLETPGSFKNVTDEQIQKAMTELPSTTMQPLPGRPSQVATDSPFYCLRALMENGGKMPTSSAGEPLAYLQDPKAIFIKSNYNNRPGTFIYTLEGVTYLTDADAQARGCYKKSGGAKTIIFDMIKGDGVDARLMTSSPKGRLTIVTPSKVPSAKTCEVDAAVMGEDFKSHMHDVVGDMALQMSKEYKETLKDLPRRLVMKNNGETGLTRPNEFNMIRAMGICHSMEVGGSKMKDALDSLRETVPDTGGVQINIEL